jgi:hypothetical protein
VAPVTERLVPGCLATAKVQGFAFGRVKLDRRKSASAMGAVAKGLFLAFPASAPIIAFSRFHLYGKWSTGGSHWLIHGSLLFI